MMIDDDLENLTSAIKFLKSSKKPVRTVDDYNVGNFSEKLVKLIFSYTSFVNREVWKKIYRAGNLRGKFEDRYNYLQL